MSSPQSPVFLSHNSIDKPAVEDIQRRLESAQPAIPCWLDKHDLRSQGTWMEQLETIIGTCEVGLVFLGKQRGPIHHMEEQLLIRREAKEGGRFRVIPVLLPEARNEDVQGFLSLYNWVDFRAGIDSPAALERLIALIRGEAPKIGIGDDPLLPKAEPYRGLERFDETHAAYFFGRDDEIRELCACIQRWPLVAVIGGSGSGKSSLVRAGLQTKAAHEALPKLQRATSIIVLPGPNPIRALADQLGTLFPGETPEKTNDEFERRFRDRPDGLLTLLTARFPRDEQMVLIVIDQFEELFTQSAERPDSFVRLLAELVHSGLARLRVVLTLRADFFDRCLTVPALVSLMANRQLLLKELTGDALREVIVKPAQQVGAFFEKGLVQHILKDVEGRRGYLPLLEHALKELWDRRHYGWLRSEDYHATGGVTGALKNRADATLKSLDPEKRELAKHIFLRLTTLGEGVSDTRRRVHLEELYPGKASRAAVNAVIDCLRDKDSRLIVTNEDGTVEVTHEALIQQWDELKTWLNENRDNKRLQDRLRDAAKEWADTSPKNAEQRDVSYLWEGGRLELAEKLDREHPERLTELERTFLGASIAKRELEKSEAEERQHRELKYAQERGAADRKIATKLRRLVLGLAVVFAVTVLIAIWAWRANERATQFAAESKKNEEKATKFAKEADNQAKIAKSNEQQADLLALRAQIDYFFSRRDDHPQQTLVGLASLLPKAERMHDQTIAKGLRLHISALSEIGSHRLLAVCGEGKPFVPMALTPDGRILLTGYHDNTARFWDAASGEPIGKPLQHRGRIVALALGANGKTALTGSDDKTTQVWEVATGKPIGPLLQHVLPVSNLALSADGRIALTRVDNKVQLWETSTGKPVGPPLEHFYIYWDAVLSPDGETVITASPTDRPMVWEVASGKLKWQVPQDISTYSTEAVALSADGTKLLTADGDVVRIWETATGKPVGQPLTHEKRVRTVAISANNKTILTGSDDKAIVWEAGTGARKGRPLPSWSPVLNTALSADGKFAAIQGHDRTIRLWDTNHSSPVCLPVQLPEYATNMALSTDGGTLATDGSNVRLWQVAINKPAKGPSGRYRALALTEDGKKALIGTLSGVEIFDTATARPIGEQPLKSIGYIWYGALSADGKIALTSRLGDDYGVQMWDTAHGQLLATLPKQNQISNIALSSDGKIALAVSVMSDTPTLWHRETKKPIQLAASDVISVAVSGDGRTAMTGGRDGVAHAWDVASGRPIGKPLPHRANVAKVALTNDGKMAVTCCLDEVRLWRVATGEPTGLPLRHQEPVTGLSISGDGRIVLTTVKSGAVRLWETWSGRPFSPLVTPLGDAGGGSSGLISADGKRAVFVAQGVAQLRTIPQPLQGDAERISLWVQATTGLRVNEQNTIHALDAAAWRKARERLHKLGGPPENE